MITDAAIWMLLKVLLTLGFALWTGVGTLNNLIGFRASAATLARTMAMLPLRDPPAIDSPLAGRALTSSHWAKAAMVAVVILQSLATLALAVGGILLLGSAAGVAAPPDGVAIALTGFALLALLWLGMMIAGLWFGYWIRQEGLQLTHIALLAVTILATMVLRG